MEMGNAQRTGFSVKVNGDWVGAYISGGVPKFFVNRDVYSLCGDEWAVELVVGKQSGLFTFYWQGQAIVSMREIPSMECFLWFYDLAYNRRNRELAG